MAAKGIYGTGGREIRGCVDRFGNIHVKVTIGEGPGTLSIRTTGANASPATVAHFLRDLADDVAALSTIPKRQGDRA